MEELTEHEYEIYQTLCMIGAATAAHIQMQVTNMTLLNKGTVAFQLLVDSVWKKGYIRRFGSFYEALTVEELNANR